jgi:predicted DNA-binding transcriptional regulator AlpA
MAEIRPFTAVAMDSELGLLSRVHAMLESDGIDSRSDFSDLMKVAFTNCRLEPRAMSDSLGFSFSTVYRWIEGRTAPHPSLWAVVANWVAFSLKARIDEIVSREAAVLSSSTLSFTGSTKD